MPAHDLTNQELLEITLNKCIKICFGLDSTYYISVTVFEKINWLPTKEKVGKRITKNISKFWKGDKLSYVNDILTPFWNSYSTRLEIALDTPLRKSIIGQKCILFLGPSIYKKSTH